MIIDKDNIGNLMSAWRDGKIPFTAKDLVDLLSYMQFTAHVSHVNTALDLIEIIFRVCENKKLEEKINQVLEIIKDDRKYDGKVIFTLLDVLKTKKIITEDEMTDITSKAIEK